MMRIQICRSVRTRMIAIVTCSLLVAVVFQYRRPLLGQLNRWANIENTNVCHGNTMRVRTSEEALPTIYVVTPTYPRLEQLPELTRLGQTLINVPKLFWIVAEDAPKRTAAVTQFLKQIGIDHVHILGQMPNVYRKKPPKGVANRLAGLDWIRRHAVDQRGVLFFADDDNTYDLRLFQEMRFTKKVSMWPVGLIKIYGVSSPVVRNGQVVGFYDGWIGGRKFPVDMAGFAVNIGFLVSKDNVSMPFRKGYEEDGFIRSLSINLNDIEPKASNCTKIYVWHTQTAKNKIPQSMSENNLKTFNGSNVITLDKLIRSA